MDIVRVCYSYINDKSFSLKADKVLPALALRVGPFSKQQAEIIAHEVELDSPAKK